MAYEHKTFDEFHVGDKTEYSRTITETDVLNYAGLTVDFSPLHLNELYAKTTMFGTRIAQGLLITAILSASSGPFFGSGAVYAGHNQRFLAPAKIGDTVTFTVEILEKKQGKQILVTRGYATNQDGTLLVDGQIYTKILPKEEASGKQA